MKQTASSFIVLSAQPLFSSTPLTTGFSDASTRLGSGDGSSNKTSKKTDQASIDMGYENIIETNREFPTPLLGHLYDLYIKVIQ